MRTCLWSFVLLSFAVLASPSRCYAQTSLWEAEQKFAECNAEKRDLHQRLDALREWWSNLPDGVRGRSLASLNEQTRPLSRQLLDVVYPRCFSLERILNALRARARAAFDEERQRAPDRAVSIATRFMPSDVGSSVLGAYRNVQSGLGTGRSLLSDYRAMTSGDAGQQSTTAIGWVQSLSGMAGGPMAGYREVGFRAVQGLHDYAQSQLDSAFANFDRDMSGGSGGGYQYALNTRFRPMLATRNQAYARLEDAIQQLQQGEFQSLPEQTAQLAALVVAVRGMQEAERRVEQARANQAAAAVQRQLEAAQASARATANAQAAQAAAQQREWEAAQQRQRAYEQAQRENDYYEQQARDAAIGRALGAAIGAFGAGRGGSQAPIRPFQSGVCTECGDPRGRGR